MRTQYIVAQLVRPQVLSAGEWGGEVSRSVRVVS